LGELDTEEKCVRFGCDSLLGVVLGGTVVLKMGWATWPSWAVAIACAAVICGLLALAFGDDFWHWILRTIGLWQ
jgi:hypothetical protein